MRFITILVLLLMLPISAFADDVVHMKNGDVYRGKIVELKMNEYVQIRLHDGNEKRLLSADIDKMDMEKETIPALPTLPATASASPKV